MNPQSDTTSNSLNGTSTPMVPVSPGQMASTSSDRLYQLAALTVGIFLLATML
jgi:hypothetical protein